MKRISPSQKAQRDRQRERRLAKALRRFKRSPALPTMVEYEAEGKLEYSAARPRPIPSRMCIETNHGQVAQLLQILRKKSSINIKNANRDSAWKSKLQTGAFVSFFDFSRITLLTPATALIMASEYDRLVTMTGAKLGAYNRRKWEPHVSQLLSDIGFFDLLGIKLAADPVDNANVIKIVKFESSEKIQPKTISTLVNLLLKMFYNIDPDLFSEEKAAKSLNLVSGLLEATENVRQHAYTSAMREDPTCLPKWWLTGAVQKEQKRLTLVVYDQGISIPARMASDADVDTWTGRQWVRRAVAKFGRGKASTDSDLDAARLRFALAYGRTSTGQANRGKGLPQIREVMLQCAWGRLTIISRHAKYVEEKGQKTRSESLLTPLAGTLIIWELSLGDE